jgi:hypothetical protein
MKALLQLLGILVVLAVVGTVYNFANSGDPTKYLDWISDYPDPTTRVASAPVAPPPRVPEAKVGTDGTGVTDTPVGTGPPAVAVDPAKPTPPPAPPFPMIGTQETFEELQAESLIIDARRTKVYLEGHIPGALSMSPWESDIDQKIAKLVEEGAILEAPVVVYCNDSKECEDSKMVAHKLDASVCVYI